MENSKMTKERWEQAVVAGSNDRNYRRERGFTETRDDYFVDGVQWAVASVSIVICIPFRV